LKQFGIYLTVFQYVMAVPMRQISAAWRETVSGYIASCEDCYLRVPTSAASCWHFESMFTHSGAFMVDKIVDRLTRSFVAGLHVIEPR